MGNLATKLEAMLRGGASGATAGWNDEGVAKLLSSLPMPQDPEGTERNYAAGSAEQDYRNTERNDANDLERRFPGSFKSGKALGAFPSLGVGGAGGVARAGLMGGARGALAGAGNATEGNRLEGAAKLAGPEAAASMLGAAAPAAVGKLKDLFGNLPPPSGGLSPAFAGAGAGMGGAAAEEGLPFINMMSTTPARGKGAVPRLSPDERIIRQDQDEWAMRNPQAANQAENSGKQAIRPQAPDTVEEAYVPEIPKATKAWPSTLNDTFNDIAKVDTAYAKQAKKAAEQLQVRDELRQGGVMPPLKNLSDPRQNIDALRQDPTWKEMNDLIYKDKGMSMIGEEGTNAPTIQAPLSKLAKEGKGTVSATQNTKTPLGPSTSTETLSIAPGRVSASKKDEDMRSLLGTMPL